MPRLRKASGVDATNNGDQKAERKMSRQRKAHSLDVKNNSEDQEAEKSLPVEILTEILIRLPLKSLAKFKCVCNFWYEVIQGRNLLELHLERSRSVYEYSEIKNAKATGDGEENSWEYQYCRDGLVLEKSKSTGKCRIRNPTTKYTLDLPGPDGECAYLRIFYVRSADEYKLVCIRKKEGEKPGGCAVLRVGADPTWRDLDCASFSNLGDITEWCWATTTDKVLFITRFSISNGSVLSEIVCLEVENERFVHFKPPQGLIASPKDVMAVRTCYWGKKMSLVRLVERELLVWVLEDYRREKWSQTKILLPSTLFGDHSKKIKNLCPFSYNPSSNRLWLWRIDGLRIAYNTATKEVVTHRAPPGYKILYSVVPSLVNLENKCLNRPQEKVAL